MIELMIKMTVWLLSSMALGFIVAWLLARTIYKKNQGYEEDSFLAVILERNNMIEKLEKSFRNKKIMFEKVSKDLINAEEALAEKTSLLTTLQHKLDNVNDGAGLALKEKNNLLVNQVQKLEQLDKKRVKELEGFEEIVLLAEDKVEKVEKNYKQVLGKLDDDVETLTLKNQKHIETMKRYEEKIKMFEEELKIYGAESSDPEFIISKDQFLQIEEQLEIYQKEIQSLKNEKEELVLKVEQRFTGLHFSDKILENKTLHELEKERDDSSMVKKLRETYKKITNS